MTGRALSVVGAEATVAQRVRALQAEARALAREHVAALVTAMEDAARIAAEVAEGGVVYPAGVRDLARRYADDAEGVVQNIQSIDARL